MLNDNTHLLGDTTYLDSLTTPEELLLEITPKHGPGEELLNSIITNFSNSPVKMIGSRYIEIIYVNTHYVLFGERLNVHNEPLGSLATAYFRTYLCFIKKKKYNNHISTTYFFDEKLFPGILFENKTQYLKFTIESQYLYCDLLYVFEQVDNILNTIIDKKLLHMFRQL